MTPMVMGVEHSSSSLVANVHRFLARTPLAPSMRFGWSETAFEEVWPDYSREVGIASVISHNATSGPCHLNPTFCTSRA